MQLTGIPEATHRYVVKGRIPLEWFIDCYKLKMDRESGIVNDANGWFKNLRDRITALERLVHVSVESSRLVNCRLKLPHMRMAQETNGFLCHRDTQLHSSNVK